MIVPPKCFSPSHRREEKNNLSSYYITSQSIPQGGIQPLKQKPFDISHFAAVEKMFDRNKPVWDGSRPLPPTTEKSLNQQIGMRRHRVKSSYFIYTMAGLPDHHHPDHHLVKAGMAAQNWQNRVQIGCIFSSYRRSNFPAGAGEVPRADPVSSGRRILFSTNHRFLPYTRIPVCHQNVLKAFF